MKNSLLLAALLFGATTTAHAEERSLADMRAAAQQALLQKGYAHVRPATVPGTAATVPGSSATATVPGSFAAGSATAASGVTTPSEALTDIQLFATHRQTAVLGYADGGFALISRDDQLPAVLAYSDGTYAEALRNPNFVNYLNTFDRYLDYCAAEGIEPRFINKAATFNPDGVKEIMKCRWDQGGPYNYMCPFVYKENDKGELDDRRCITGCVATAMAQILYTLHQKFGTDIKLRGAKHYYYIDDAKHLAYETANFASIPLDWDNMLDTYSSTTGHMQNMAVARLMYACGVAAEMMYSTGASGTYCSTANDGLNTFFEGIKAEYSGYGLDGWEQRIYDELDAGRPVLLSGANAENSGHAFVGDGYDKEGKLHLNLGWSGGGNTWATIANMAGFEQAQTVNFIYPEDNDALVLSKDAPLDELKDKYITADLLHPAEDIIEGQWYVLYNKGRYASAYSTGLGKKLQCSSYVPVADPAEIAAPMVVRFIAKTGTKQYFIQTGTGDYFGGLDYGTNYGSESNPSFPYSWGKIQGNKTKKYFYFKQGSTVLDCNAPGGQGVAGWGTQIPTDTLGHAAWLLLPVHFSDSPEIPTIGPNNFNPDHRYILVNYDGAKNYYFNLKATCSIAPKNPTELRLTPANGGWQISSFADESLVVSAKSKDFKLGNNSTASEYPLTFSFEPIPEAISTGDPEVDACSRFFRIRCESGYLAPTKIALGGNIYNNLGFHAALGRWQLIDQTELDELLLEGIQTPLADEASSPSSPFPSTSYLNYDLQGRRVTTTHKGLYIQSGKKLIK